MLLVMTRLNLAQRLVLVIGLGFGLAFFGEWVTIQGTHSIGWVGYAPLSGATFTPLPGGLHEWVKLMIWLGLTIIWTSAALILLRPRAPLQLE